MNEIEAERQSDLKSQKELLNSVLPEDKNDVETTITIRLPASLKEALKADAESRGINLSDYVRVKLSAQSLPIRRRPRQQVSRVERGLLVELNRIGINLNQAVRKLNSQEYPQVNSAERQIFTQLLEMLQKIELALISEVEELKEET